MSLTSMTDAEKLEWYKPFLARHGHNPDFLAHEDKCVQVFIEFIRSSYPHDMGGYNIEQSGDNIVRNVAMGFFDD